MATKEKLNNPNPIKETPQTKVIDYDQVRRLAKIGCTHKEIAAVLEIDVTTLYFHEKRDPKLKAIIEKGIEQGRADLRRWQHKAARRGQNAMLIWLGKQELGQTEKVDPRTLPQSTENLDLSRLSDAEFAHYRALQDKAAGKISYPIPTPSPNDGPDVALSIPDEVIFSDDSNEGGAS